jgi:DNA-binding transcriptional ArsR family regulator
LEPSEIGPSADLEAIEDPLRAGVLLRPLRLRIMALARQPASATELARRLELPRQRVHYHVHALAKAGFLRPAGRVRKRNLVEQRYIATARAYLLSPGVLGPLAADWRSIGRTTSTDYVLALTEQVRADIVGAARQAGGAAEAAPETLSLKSQFRFENPRRQADFSNAARRALIEAIARHTVPAEAGGGRRGRSGLYRLVMTCYPAPEPAPEAAKGGAP